MRCGRWRCARRRGRRKRCAKQPNWRLRGWVGWRRRRANICTHGWQPMHSDRWRTTCGTPVLPCDSSSTGSCSSPPRPPVRFANALYGASALDLPRRGVVHLQGGIGAIAATLAAAVRANGGQVLYRQEVARIVFERGRPVAVVTKRGDHFPADRIVANLPPWNIARLLGDAAPPALRRLPEQPQDGWGAFMVYVGLDNAAIPADAPLHHQVLAQEPLGEGNSVFLSLNPAWDSTRAPAGKRALTISTHTAFAPWWRLYQQDPAGYAARKDAYVNRMLTAAERALPGLREAAALVLPGTPVTFQRFTRRAWGWVGGFPQTNLFRAWGPRLLPQLWMVGDSIFPGQSTAAVALGGLRVGRSILAEFGVADDGNAAHREREVEPLLT